MKTKALVRRIKRQERSERRPPLVAQKAAGPDIWSKSVRSWVDEFQKRDQPESQPGFDSLFTDSQPDQIADSD